jgi:hypothetical protein
VPGHWGAGDNLRQGKADGIAKSNVDKPYNMPGPEVGEVDRTLEKKGRFR